MVVDVSDLDRQLCKVARAARHEGFLGEAATIPDAYLDASGSGQNFPAEMRGPRLRSNGNHNAPCPLALQIHPIGVVLPFRNLGFPIVKLQITPPVAGKKWAGPDGTILRGGGRCISIILWTGPRGPPVAIYGPPVATSGTHQCIAKSPSQPAPGNRPRKRKSKIIAPN